MKSKAFAITAAMLGLALGACGSTQVGNSTAKTNNAPTISAIALSAAKTAPGTSVVLTVTASDPDGDALTYTFSRGTCDGSLSGGVEGTAQAANVATFDAGSTIGAGELKATVTDARGLTATGTVTLDVEQPGLQAFEVDTAGWTATQGITRVASGSGTLGVPASAGGYYAEVQNKLDAYQAGYGDAGFSYFGGKGTEYKGDFYQAIDVYVDAKWAPAANPGVDGFWIDMTPYHADPDNYGAEHNFRLRATGNQVDVRIDAQTNPIASITESGWYTFLMTFQKGVVADEPVVTQMVILNAQHATVGSAAVAATSPGGPFKSKDLLGNGYVWITVWQNGFAGDTLAIDNLKTALLPQQQPQQKSIFLQGFETDASGWNAALAINQVASGGGALHLTPSAGGYYAEIANKHDDYLPGYGDGAYSYYGGKGKTYQGDFYQSIDVYIDTTWAPPSGSTTGADGFFVDMTPYHADPANYGAEHTFYVHATGSEVTVRADTQPQPFANITTSGWYTFLMTFEKGIADDEPVVTQMLVLDAQHNLVGSTVGTAIHDTGPFLSKDLMGNGYVWITGWPDGFANDVLAIDDAQTALLPYP